MNLTATYDLDDFGPVSAGPVVVLERPDWARRVETLRDEWESAQRAVEAARTAYLTAIEDARVYGATLEEVGKVLGVSRQAVSKMLRQESTRAERVAYLDRDSRKGAGRKSGWRNGTPQCQACRRIMSAYNAKCPSCHGWSQSA